LPHGTAACDAFGPLVAKAHGGDMLLGELAVGDLLEGAAQDGVVEAFLNGEGDPRVAQSVRGPAPADFRVHDDGTVLEHVPHDGLVRAAVRVDGRDHRVTRSGEELTDRRRNDAGLLQIDHATMAPTRPSRRGVPRRGPVARGRYPAGQAGTPSAGRMRR